MRSALNQAVMDQVEEAEPLKPITAVDQFVQTRTSSAFADHRQVMRSSRAIGLIPTVSFVRSVKDKLMESETLRAQARANSEAQFKRRHIDRDA